MDKNKVKITGCQSVDFYRDERAVLKDISISIRPGKITAIMGPSGCGKTTLLHLLIGLLTPNRGEVQLIGSTLNRLSQSELYALRRRIGMLFQNAALFTDMSVFDNVAFPLREHTNLSANMIHDIVLMKLQAVGLRGATHLMPGQLSGGMSRRVALARAIALDPEIIFYDEPFTGQDPISKGVLVKLIKTINHALGATSVLVSHDVAETMAIADYVYVIADGRIIAEGSPDQLPSADNSLAHQFLQGIPDGEIPFHFPAEEYAEAFA